MAESYFKDPLLAKWEQGASPITLSMLKNARVHETCDAPLILTAIRDYTPESPTETAWVVTGDFVRLNGMLIAELSAAREMREVLREVEWQGDVHTYAACPCCHGLHYHEGHAPDCRLARLIGGGE